MVYRDYGVEEGNRRTRGNTGGVNQDGKIEQRKERSRVVHGEVRLRQYSRQCTVHISLDVHGEAELGK